MTTTKSATTTRRWVSTGCGGGYYEAVKKPKKPAVSTRRWVSTGCGGGYYETVPKTKKKTAGAKTAPRKATKPSEKLLKQARAQRERSSFSTGCGGGSSKPSTTKPSTPRVSSGC